MLWRPSCSPEGLLSTLPYEVKEIPRHMRALCGMGIVLLQNDDTQTSMQRDVTLTPPQFSRCDFPLFVKCDRLGVSGLSARLRFMSKGG